MADYDLDTLRQKLEEIKRIGWIKTRRKGNDGGVGNTLEDLLSVAENNLQLPDFGKWELKSQRSKSSLLTLFHCEPEPRDARVVPSILLPLYGWRHQGAGTEYPESERSFRQTISALNYSDRGFKVNVDRGARRVFISFDFDSISAVHSEWRDFIKNGVGMGDLFPVPYWTFEQLEQKLNTKLSNLSYIFADRKKIDGEEYFKYDKIEIHLNPTLDNFLRLLENGSLYIDFDARTGHNHGTKFRIRPAMKADLYQEHIIF